MSEAGTEGSRFAFLYRSEKGTIDARGWGRAALPLVLLFALSTGVWLLLRPFATRGLDQRALLDPGALTAGLATVLYVFLAILLAVCWVNLCAKRFRDAGWPQPLGLAGLVPLVALLDGALHWLQPRLADVLPRVAVYLGDAVVVGVFAWTVGMCGGWNRHRS